MLERLQKKWKVSGLQLVLIFCTFAFGGSLTGYAGRKLLGTLGIEQDWLRIIIYILLITLLWPLAVLLVSIPFGQFRFFMKYIRKIGARVGLVKRSQPATGNSQPEFRDQQAKILLKTNIAIFASGTGSNAQKIIDHFRNSSSVNISLIACNKPGAGVLAIAGHEKIPSLLIEKEKFFRGTAYMEELRQEQIGFVVLAGFMWKLPPAIITAYPGRIINIHPALLPAYGGKGMFGHFVHEAVLASKEKETGISIHYVDELYDHGTIIFQARCPVFETDTADTLAGRIHELEHEHYPKVIERVISGLRPI